MYTFLPARSRPLLAGTSPCLGTGKTVHSALVEPHTSSVFVEDVHEVSKGCILTDNVEQLEHETKSGITCATYEGGGQRCIERKRRTTVSERFTIVTLE